MAKYRITLDVESYKGTMTLSGETDNPALAAETHVTLKAIGPEYVDKIGTFKDDKPIGQKQLYSDSCAFEDEAETTPGDGEEEIITGT